jgi:hypothetical protein
MVSQSSDEACGRARRVDQCGAEERMTIRIVLVVGFLAAGAATFAGCGGDECHTDEGCEAGHGATGGGGEATTGSTAASTGTTTATGAGGAGGS